MATAVDRPRGNLNRLVINICQPWDAPNGDPITPQLIGVDDL